MKLKNVIIVGFLIGLLAAAWAVMVAYAHHAFGRAGASHLAQSFHPFLVGMLAVGSLASSLGIQRTLKTVSVMLVCVAVAGVLVVRPSVRQLLSQGPAWEPVPVVRGSLTLPPAQAREIEAFRRIHAHCIGLGQAFFVAPAWPAAYPLLETQPPAWDTYFMFRETERRQRRLIEQLETAGVQWVFLSESGLDGLEERRFRNTYPLVYRWIENHFVEVPVTDRPGAHRVLHRADSLPAGRPHCEGLRQP